MSCQPIEVMRRAICGGNIAGSPADFLAAKLDVPGRCQENGGMDTAQRANAIRKELPSGSLNLVVAPACEQNAGELRRGPQVRDQ